MKQTPRLMSLDALRGFDMFFIMGLSGLIVSICALFPCATTDFIAQQMFHVKWDGLAHHDTIFPLFLFLAGVSFPFSYAKQQALGVGQKSIYLKIFRRAALLILFGAIYNGLFEFDFANLRLASVLGRIGLAWMFAALLFINFDVRKRVGIAVTILIGYALLSKFVAAPDVIGADLLSAEGSLAGYIDRLLLPGAIPYYGGRFDPEGLFSTLPAIVTAMLGMFAGELIRLPEEKLSGEKKTILMLAGAVVLGVVAFVGDSLVPVNKNLWSSSFVCAVGAYSLFMMALFYYVIDVRGWNGRWTLLFRVVGMNSITIYMAQSIVNFGGISDFFIGGLAGHCPELWAEVVKDFGYVVVCWLFLYFLYRQKIFLKV